MKTSRFLIPILVSVAVAGCVAGGGTVGLPNGSQGAATSTHTLGHFIVMGATRNGSCASKYVACVTVSRHVSSPSVYFCYSPGSYCGPSQPQYLWASGFFISKSQRGFYKFGASLNPNPGNPTYDTIYETKNVKSSHGKVKYEQAICPTGTSGCIAGPFWVGIITQ